MIVIVVTHQLKAVLITMTSHTTDDKVNLDIYEVFRIVK